MPQTGRFKSHITSFSEHQPVERPREFNIMMFFDIPSLRITSRLTFALIVRAEKMQGVRQKCVIVSIFQRLPCVRCYEKQGALGGRVIAGMLGLNSGHMCKDTCSLRKHNSRLAPFPLCKTIPNRPHHFRQPRFPKQLGCRVMICRSFLT